MIDLFFYLLEYFINGISSIFIKHLMIIVIFILIVLLGGAYLHYKENPFLEKIGVYDFVEKIKKFFNRKQYLLQYNFKNYGENTEAISFIRQFHDEIKKIGRKYKKVIHLANLQTNDGIDNKTIMLQGYVNEQLSYDNKGKLNIANFMIKYLGATQEIQCLISQSDAGNDIEKYNKTLVDKIETIFVILVAFNGDYQLAEKIIEKFDTDNKLLLWFHINCFKLEDINISYENKNLISKNILDQDRIPMWLNRNLIRTIYAKSLYKVGNTQQSEKIIDIMKGIDSNNPAWYINKAFFYLYNNNLKKGFEEYEKMRDKFTYEDMIKKIKIYETIQDLKDESNKSNYFILGYLYLSYYYCPEKFDLSLVSDSIDLIQSKLRKKRLMSRINS